MQTLEEPVIATIGNNARCLAKGKGTISFVIENGETKKNSNVLYVPKIKRNLLSIATIIDVGHMLKFTKIGVEILNSSGKVVGKGERRNNLYELSALIASTCVGTTKLWHERFGHIGHVVFKEMHKHGMVAHLLAVSKMKEPCESCMLCKKQRKGFPQEITNRASAPLELVHANLCYKMPTKALVGSSYFLLLVNNFSRKMLVYFLLSKAQAFGEFKE